MQQKDDDKCHRLFVKEVVSTYCKFRLYLQVINLVSVVLTD